jgi:circadian clock protein KaiC
MEGRKSIGISRLDDLIEGGILEETIVMVEGDAGTGKSTMAVQYLLAGINAGDKCIYVSVDEAKKSLYRNMGRFGFRLDEHDNAGMLLFHEFKPHQMRDFLDKGMLGIEEQIMQMKPKRLVLDSITAFALLYDSEAKQRTAVHNLFEKIRNWGLTTIIVAEAAEENQQFGLRYLVDGWIRLSRKKVGQERVRTVEVLKMRGTKHDTNEIVYRIEKNGINLYPNERILSTEI